MMGSNSICDDLWFEVGSPVCNLPRQDQINLLIDDLLKILTDLETRGSSQTKKSI